MVSKFRGVRVLWLFTLPYALTVCALASDACASSGSLVFAGSGSNLPITRKLVRAYNRSHGGIRIDIPASIGSTGAIRAVADGAIALGLVSRPLLGDEKKLGLAVERYALTATVIGVHPGVVDDTITFQELVDVYRGTKNRWKDGKAIIVLTREPGDSTIDILENGVPGFRTAFRESQRARRWLVIYSDQEMNRHLESTPYGIGFSDSGAITADRLEHQGTPDQRHCPDQRQRAQRSLPADQNTFLRIPSGQACSRGAYLSAICPFEERAENPAGKRVRRCPLICRIARSVLAAILPDDSSLWRLELPW